MLQGSQILQERYQLKQQLGRNAGRQTWLATDIAASPAEEFAIVKLLAFSPQMQWDDFKLFEREAQVLKNLNHPRIPRYRDYFSLDKQMGSGLCWFALVQDYIPGASLQQLIDEGKRFTEAQVRQIAADILQILIDLHELNPTVLHRDIKPSNLILGENGQVYLVDFGAVQDQAAAEGVTFTVVGTTGYAPLEQFWGKAVPASDLYALGATLIHLLTGIAPADLPQNNLRIQFSNRVSINPNLVRWIEALTAPDLEQRYSTARQALEDLKANRYLNAPLQKIRSPAASRIQLWKSPTQLKIAIPSRRIGLIRETITFTVKSLLAGSSAISLFLHCFLYLMMLIFIVVGLGFALFFLNIVAVGLFVMLIPLLIFFNRLQRAIAKELGKVPSDLNRTRFSGFEHACLWFNPEDFILEKRLFGWSYLRRRGQTKEIKSIKIDRKGVTVKTKLESYSFGRALTDSERQWVAQEIRDWLR
jgi:serine/threonine protein kinase